MRALASRLGVRASSLYRHFPDRAAIEKSLAARAADDLLQQMRGATKDLTGEQALSAVLNAYVSYTTLQRPFYDVLMSSFSDLQSPGEANPPIWNFFVDLLSRVTPFPNDEGGAAALWSYLHGFSVLFRQTADADKTQHWFTRGSQALAFGLTRSEAEAAHSSN